jgi:hypothetical protein
VQGEEGRETNPLLEKQPISRRRSEGIEPVREKRRSAKRFRREAVVSYCVLDDRCCDGYWRWRSIPVRHDCAGGSMPRGVFRAEASSMPGHAVPESRSNCCEDVIGRCVCCEAQRGTGEADHSSPLMCHSARRSSPHAQRSHRNGKYHIHMHRSIRINAFDNHNRTASVECDRHSLVPQLERRHSALHRLLFLPIPLLLLRTWSLQDTLCPLVLRLPRRPRLG